MKKERENDGTTVTSMLFNAEGPLKASMLLNRITWHVVIT